MPEPILPEGWTLGYDREIVETTLNITADNVISGRLTTTNIY
jgi:hypothetical protein